jgi:UDP:flavonoid glycosyltransferase YjiC (YdhE family)
MWWWCVVDGQPFADVMQRKNFLFCGPSLETRHETVEFPFELLPPSRRHNKGEAAADEAETGKGKEESGEETSEEHRSLVYISMGTLYRMNPLFFQTCFAAFKNSPHLFVMSVGKGNLGT